MSKKDYDNLIKQSKTERKLLENEAAAIRRVIRNNLRNGLWTKNSQEYKDAVQRLREINNKIQECVTSQIEWNNAIEQIPFDRVDEMVEWLDAAANRYTSGVDLKKAQGKDLSKENYTRQISDNNKKIKQLTNKSALAMANYYKAMGNKNHVFGGKKAGDWLKLARDSQAEINKIRTENEKLMDDLRDDVYWRTYERMHEALDRTAKILGDISDLISSDMYFDENGNLTIFGTSQIANFVKQYENARDQVKAYANDIKNLNKLYKNGQYTALEYREKLNEIQDKLLNSAGDMKKYLESIKNMYKDMAKSELDALYKLIDARNDALSSKKACA